MQFSLWIFLSNFLGIYSQFFGTWNARLANWNTGRVYMQENNNFGYFRPFGAVCQEMLLFFDNFSPF